MMKEEFVHECEKVFNTVASTKNDLMRAVSIAVDLENAGFNRALIPQMVIDQLEWEQREEEREHSFQEMSTEDY